MEKILLFVSKPYSFEILRPIQQEILNQKKQVAWFVFDKNDWHHLNNNETHLLTVNDVLSFNPDAVIAPGNWVPPFFPGLKIQVFHGFGIDKKGHFRIRNYFDLYCTHGPVTTNRFKKLASTFPHFAVIETGWPKMDPLFTDKNINPIANQILYAPTFSPSLTSVDDLFPVIKELTTQYNWKWIIKFHPKQDKKTIQRYQSIENDNLSVSNDISILPLLQSSSVLLTDTSSVISEFMLLDKPVITFNGSDETGSMTNVNTSENLLKVLKIAINQPDKIVSAQQEYIAKMHPYADGNSAKRVIDAIGDFQKNIKSSLNKKPINTFRNLKIRWKMKYFRMF